MGLTRAQAELSRRMWDLAPGQQFHFWFSALDAPGLLLEPLSDAGTARFVEQLPEADGVVGQAVVDSSGQLVFTGPEAVPELLGALAAWAQDNIATIPALAALIDAGTATSIGDGIPSADDADILRAPALWASLLKADAAGAAEVLSSCQPGERLWYWLWPDAPPGTPVVVLQRAEEDPDAERLNHITERLDPDGAALAATGVCTPVDDGSLQLRGTTLRSWMLPPLAAWVTENVGAHPGLARLRDCALLQSNAAGRITAVHADPALWVDTPAITAPGTLAEAAERLLALQPGEAAWYWLNDTQTDLPHLSLVPLDGDPDGTAFRARARRCSRRFPGAPLVGTVSCLQSGALLFSNSSTSDGRRWVSMVAALMDHDDLFVVLADAHMVRLEGGQIVHTWTASPL